VIHTIRPTGRAIPGKCFAEIAAGRARTRTLPALPGGNRARCSSKGLVSRTPAAIPALGAGRAGRDLEGRCEGGGGVAGTSGRQPAGIDAVAGQWRSPAARSASFKRDRHRAGQGRRGCRRKRSSTRRTTIIWGKGHSRLRGNERTAIYKRRARQRLGLRHRAHHSRTLPAAAHPRRSMIIAFRHRPRGAGAPRIQVAGATSAHPGKPHRDRHQPRQRSTSGAEPGDLGVLGLGQVDHPTRWSARRPPRQGTGPSTAIRTRTAERSYRSDMFPLARCGAWPPVVVKGGPALRGPSEGMGRRADAGLRAQALPPAVRRVPRRLGSLRRRPGDAQLAAAGRPCASPNAGANLPTWTPGGRVRGRPEVRLAPDQGSCGARFPRKRPPSMNTRKRSGSRLALSSPRRAGCRTPFSFGDPPACRAGRWAGQRRS